MSDIFSEVDEDVRKDQSLVLWKKYGPYVIAISVAVMVGVGGVTAWRAYQKNQRLAQADIFLNAVNLTDEAARIEALKQVSSENAGVYGALAQIRMAMDMAENNPEEAIAVLDKVAGTAVVPVQMRQLAEIRAASITADTKSPADVLQRVNPLLSPDHAFRFSARELAAVAEIQLGNKDAARTHLQTLIEDQQTPSGIRSRTEALMAVIGEGDRS